MPKTLVLCFDGTDGQYATENSNVVKLFALLSKSSPSEQLCYYQPGIGTYFAPGVINPAFQWAAKILDEAFAWYLYAHVTAGYSWLVDHHLPGDHIVITGFSRGAYTARALAGFVHKIGLISTGNEELLPFAYKLYARTDKEGEALAAGFKAAFGRDVAIDFVGVWDTVVSVGVIASQSLPFTATNEGIKTFRHALALDEHRVRFMPNLYHRFAPDPDGAKNRVNAAKRPKYAGLSPEAVQEAVTKANKSTKRFGKHMRRAHKDIDSSELPQPSLANTSNASASSVEGSQPQETIPGGTDVLEVWFAGAHADVGGSSVPDSTPSMLSNVPLRWMARELATSPVPILWAPGAFETLGITPNSESGVMGNGKDALSPIYDPLGWKGSWSWWILECIPLTVACQDQEGKWKRSWRINFGRGRRILLEHPLFHESVRERSNEKSLKYVPRAQWRRGSESYVR